MNVYFLGVWPGYRAAHVLHGRDGWPIRSGGMKPPSPWGTARFLGSQMVEERLVLSAAWPDHYVGDDVEGRARVVHKDGWTLVSMWDRSGDSRHGSHSSFIIDKHLEPEEALRVAKEHYPTVFHRIEQHLNRAVVLDGSDPAL